MNMKTSIFNVNIFASSDFENVSPKYISLILSGYTFYYLVLYIGFSHLLVSYPLIWLYSWFLLPVSLIRFLSFSRCIAWTHQCNDQQKQQMCSPSSSCACDRATNSLPLSQANPVQPHRSSYIGTGGIHDC